MAQKTQLAAIRQWLPGSDLSPVVFPVSRTLRTLFADMDNRKTDQQHNTRCFPDEQPPGPPPRSRPNFDGVRTSEGQKPHCGQAGHEPTAFSGLKRSIREAGSNDAPQNHFDRIERVGEVHRRFARLFAFRAR